MEEGLRERIEGLVGGGTQGEEEEEDRRRRVSEDAVRGMMEGKATLLGLVEMLGPLLTDADSTRARTTGTLVLVDVLRKTRAVLTRHEVDHVLAFLCARLKDWHTLRATLLACKVLLEGGEDKGSKSCLTAANVELLAKSLFEHVDVQSHSQPNRQLSFELVDLLLRDPHLATVLGMSARATQAENAEEEDLLEVLVRFVDGEKDPRCLLLAFDSIERAVHELSKSGRSELVEVVKKNVEGLADVLSCYFPLSFSPPPDMKKSVTRADLLLALFRAYTSTPEMFPQVVQLLEDRFPSPKSETKVDGLQLLQMCLEKFANDLRADYEDESKKAELEALIDQVWDLLRGQILRSEPMLNMVNASGAVVPKALEALKSLADLFSISSLKVVDLAFEDEDVKKALVACSSTEDLEAESKPHIMMHCRALDVLSTIASSSVFVFAGVVDRTSAHTSILENISTQPTLLIHFVYKMTCALEPLKNDVFSDSLGVFKETLPELCSKLLAYLAVGSQDAEDNYRTTSECIKALDNVCKFQSEWISMELIEEVMMGLLAFSLSDSRLTTKDHIIHTAKIISSFHEAHRRQDVMDKVITKTLNALVGEVESDRALLFLSVIAECAEECTGECTELSMDIVVKLTQRAIDSWKGEMGWKSNRVSTSILSMVSVSIMPHLYECNCKLGGIPKPVSKIMKNLVLLLEKVLESQETGNGLFVHILHSISYATLLCGEEMQKGYVREAVALLLSEEQIVLEGKLLRFNLDSAVSKELRYLLVGAVLNPLKSAKDVENVEDVLHSILEFIMTLDDPNVARELSISLSGIVNKLEKNQLDEIVLPLVTEVLLNHMKTCDNQTAVEVGFYSLAWITRALAMKKYSKLEMILDEMFSILCSPDYEWEMSTCLDLGETFSLVICTQYDNLIDTWNWKAKLLWRQKLFSTLSTKVFAKFEEKRGNPNVMIGLHQIFSCLMTSVHFSVLKPFAQDIVVNLIHSISLLLEQDLPEKRAVVANLALLKLALTDDSMRRVIQDHIKSAVEGLVAACCTPSTTSRDILLRRRALECLALLKDLPHYILFPYFHDVRRRLQVCLDDSKREVRQQAGKTLRLWTGVST
ncbi:nucleotide excision repair protein [Chloropicon primus]|uniref:MMS19 nucleotide excision repair protein n=2 Tax=Chloropicon primus TaxID=1764295 RepID=A0A5B8MQB3_9CHLO|nr:nucleotide excision repair protein [Chloropicon primus]UPR00702.1 nucleotide excision repair protein [Chloropicon primus]|eukprot:QDZ21492.1 nucleotide excision repair protein [Chloropicon primus]